MTKNEKVEEFKGRVNSSLEKQLRDLDKKEIIKSKIEKGNKSRKRNIWGIWISVLFGVSAVDPLPYDLIPFVGPPAIIIGIISFLATYFFWFKKDVIGESLIFTLASQEKGATFEEMVNLLDMRPGKITKVLKELLRRGIIYKEKINKEEAEKFNNLIFFSNFYLKEGSQSNSKNISDIVNNQASLILVDIEELTGKILKYKSDNHLVNELLSSSKEDLRLQLENAKKLVVNFTKAEAYLNNLNRDKLTQDALDLEQKVKDFDREEYQELFEEKQTLIDQYENIESKSDKILINLDEIKTSLQCFQSALMNAEISDKPYEKLKEEIKLNLLSKREVIEESFRDIDWELEKLN